MRRASACPARARAADPLAAPLSGGALQRCACGGGCPACRAKAAGLAAVPIHPADDVYERKADRVADRVMRGGRASALGATPTLPSISRLQRCSCGGGGTCPECGAKQNEEDLQRSASGPGGPGVAPPIVHEVLRSSGQPLDAASRAFFEPRFGRGFGEVRVHTDARAAESARAVGAVAYTVGANLVFDAGRYAPGSAEGRRLLAHELAHVVQQDGRPVSAGPLPVAPADAPEEHVAQAAAARVAAGQAVPPLGGVARQAVARQRPAAPPTAPAREWVPDDPLCRVLLREQTAGTWQAILDFNAITGAPPGRGIMARRNDGTRFDLNWALDIAYVTGEFGGDCSALVGAAFGTLGQVLCAGLGATTGMVSYAFARVIGGVVTAFVEGPGAGLRYATTGALNFENRNGADVGLTLGASGAMPRPMRIRDFIHPSQVERCEAAVAGRGR